MKNILNKIREFSVTGKISLFILLLIIITAIFAPLLTEFSYRLPSGEAFESPSFNHLLGTDDLGIDIWSQISYGARISLLVGIGTALLAGIGGTIIGVLAGYFGGKTDRVLMRFTDMMIVIPDLPVMIVLAAFFGSSIFNIIIVLSLFSWTIPARLVRSQILHLKEENYIKAAKSYGAGFFHITLKHFIPHILPLMMVNVIKIVNKAVIAEASLAFLGLGNPTSKSWGVMLYHGLNFNGIYFTDFWKWWILSPLIAILILVLSIAFISRDMERIIDTKI